jgi:hypothetical protein
MKRIMKTAVLAFILVLGSSLRNNARAQYNGNDYGGNGDVSYQTFYDQLSPYGQWIDYPGYGYVWVPDVDADFRPYDTNGHWVYTDDYEWMWVSDYDWGWAPFHYGRWEEDTDYGWFWVPGYEWSPAWVAWRDGGDYYGWAPLRPGINIGINFNLGGYNPPSDYWCFVPRQYITSPRLYDYCLDRRRNTTIINFTTIINRNNYRAGFGFRTGPARYDAERYIGRINPVRIRDSYRPGRTSFRDNEVTMYHPNFRRDDNRSSAPRQFERYDRNNAGSFRNRDNGNGSRRNDNIVNNNNDNNRGWDRNNQPNVRQPQTDNNDRRRNDNNNGGGFRPDRNNGNQDANNNNNGNGFPRRDQPRSVQPQDQPRSVQPQEQPRVDRRNDNRDNQQFQRNDQPQQQPRTFDRGNDNRGNQQFRRNDQPRDNGNAQPRIQPQQEQPRQFERRNDARVDRQPSQQPVQQPRQESSGFQRREDRRQDNGNNGNGNNNGGGRKGRGRF